MSRPREPDHAALHLLREALDLDTDLERERLLAARCTDDPPLLERVRAMLQRIGGDDGPESPEDATDSLLDARLGAFRVAERIGRGGMGVVYRGEREGADFRQDVALKLIRRGFDFDDIRARFLRERRILARLSHPNLARFIDGGVAPDGRPWFALEFVRGEPVTRWCDARSLDLRARVKLFLDVCAAVQYAHAQLVVHRDLKPGNILVEADGHVRLLDFGIARLLGGEDAGAAPTTLGHRGVLTPEYAAPEQFGGETAGVATDVYALGVVLYELLVGVLPYELDRRDLAATEHTIRERPPQPPAQAIARGGHAASAARLAARSTHLRPWRNDVRGDLTRILDKALAKEPARRYTTVEAFAEDLSRWLAGAPVRASGTAFGYRLGKFVRRNRVAVAVALGLAVALLAATALALRSARNERLQREAAVAEAERANAVQQYLTLMFRNATQRQREGAVLTADEVLRQGADDIFEYFRDQPETGQATALMLSEIYAALGDADGGAPLLERLLKWPGVEARPDLQASARFGLATAEHHRGHDARARELLAAAQAYWNSRPERHRESLSRSRTLQARLERMQGDTDAAIATLDRGIRERRALHDGADGESAYALVTLSITLAQVGRIEEAFARAQESVAEYERLRQALSSEGLTALGNRAAIATMLNRDEEALADLRKVSATLRVYGDSEALAKADAQLGELLGKLARYDEAVPLLQGALAMAGKRSGERGRLAFGARQRLAQVLMDAGRPEEAEPLIDSLLAQAREAYGESNRDTGIGYRMRAQLRIAQRRLDDARVDLTAAEQVFTGLGAAGQRQIEKVAALRQSLDASTAR
ncbi:protein kinase domain-containing protein [Dokdonella ginsengisoli]|uniref:Protein kinase n=1 Tax=Dokdonella ginsengisoli TaxID=363846 RepID=A0ABV9QW49_9GAMM